MLIVSKRRNDLQAYKSCIILSRFMSIKLIVSKSKDSLAFNNRIHEYFVLDLYQWNVNCYKINDSLTLNDTNEQYIFKEFTSIKC